MIINTATEIVKDLYDKFPEVNFIDERDLGKMVGLIFELGKVNIDDLKTYIEKNYDCWYKIENGRLFVKAYEDDFYESLQESTLNESYNQYGWWPMYTDNWDKLPYDDDIIKSARENVAGFGLDLNEVLNKINPSDKDIYHIYQAKKKMQEKHPNNWRFYSGININAIEDVNKLLNYLYAAILVKHSGYMNKLDDLKYNFRGLKLNDVSLTGNLIQALGIILTTDPNNLQSKVANAITVGDTKKDKAQKRKEAKTAAAATAANTPVSPDVQMGTFVNNANYFFPTVVQNSFQQIMQNGNDITIDATSKTEQQKFKGPNSSWKDNVFVTKFDITFNDGKVGEYKDVIEMKKIGRDDDSVFVFSGKEFKNLPLKQFTNWMNRKLKQEKENSVVQNSTVDDEETTVETEVEEESLKENFDYDENLIEFYEEECKEACSEYLDGVIKKVLKLVEEHKNEFETNDIEVSDDVEIRKIDLKAVDKFAVLNFGVWKGVDPEEDFDIEVPIFEEEFIPHKEFEDDDQYDNIKYAGNVDDEAWDVYNKLIYGINETFNINLAYLEESLKESFDWQGPGTYEVRVSKHYFDEKPSEQNIYTYDFEDEEDLDGFINDVDENETDEYVTKFDFAEKLPMNESMWDTKFKGYWVSPDTNKSHLLCGTNDETKIKNMMRKQFQGILENPWNKKDEKIFFIKTAFVTDDSDGEIDIEDIKKEFIEKAKSLKESNESLKESKEIDRKGFVSLIKYDTFDPNGNYAILNDGNFVKSFWADNDEEAKETFDKESSTKINIRESLNKIDWYTNNKYDLRNMYDSSNMNQQDKYELAKMISMNESYENISEFLNKFI